MNGTDMSFGNALEAMRVGLKVGRPHWKKTGNVLCLIPKTNQNEELVALLDTNSSFIIEYDASSDDILAQDWMVVRD
jgi:hypothetical protein